MLKLKNITAKNFLSIGNATQAISLDRNDLTLVLGKNLDLGGDDAGAKNGVGKSAIVNAISYALYGSAISNIKKDNLINRTNGKNMLVTIEFEKDGIEYRIERGRKPNTMAFYVSGQEKEITDESQGDSRETQDEIERILGMSHEMFKHIVTLNTYTEPFLNLKANDQRTIIEQLLGVTMLSDKAAALKEQIKVTKDEISQEEYRIKAVTDANARIQEQIEATRRRQNLWKTKYDKDIAELVTSLEQINQLDIDKELENHTALAEYEKKESRLKNLAQWIKGCKQDQSKLIKTIDKLKAEIEQLEKHECYACGQPFHDEKHESVLKSKQDSLQEAALQYLSSETQMEEHIAEVEAIGDIGDRPEVFYDKKEDAINHKITLENLAQQLESKQHEVDPYADQIREMETLAIEDIDYEPINQLNTVKEHQEFLLKLLTNKDSFIRKRIIDQNLSYLNSRLDQYLDQIGLPHTVKFNNDLSVSIEELGRELDSGNLSRGESTRLSLSLSFAFRDVWENLCQPINLLFVDEVVDSGMDTAGVENSLKILKKMARDGNRSVWLVSHKDELAGRVNNVLSVVKESGFTTYATDVDIT